MTRRSLPAVLVTAVLFGACGYAELLDFVEGTGGGASLTDPSQPTAVQAAGSVAEAEEKDRQAREIMEEVKDPDLGVGTKIVRVGDAIALRPADPRLLVYRARLNDLAGDFGSAEADLKAAIGLLEASNDRADADRKFLEFVLETDLTLMGTYEPGSATHLDILDAYCFALAGYSAQFGDTLVGSAYLDFTARGDLCSP